MGEYERIRHSFSPVYDKDSTILILGSFPSVKSREENFFYGHPRNRFWTVLSSIYHDLTPKTVEEKKQFLQRHHIALWDVIQECDIIGSSDSSIRNVTPTDIPFLLNHTAVTHIFTNGKTASRLYRKYIEPTTAISSIELPSTSPANASYSLERLIATWNEKLKPTIK